ncbi:MAG: hypothetical protein IIX27_05935, partial [Ruminococcus sp.]|nr:hypothetical protein [Ruminococcus sp.]
MALTYYIRSWDPRSTYPTNPQEGDICYTITLDQTWAPVGGVKKDNIVKEEIYCNYFTLSLLHVNAITKHTAIQIRHATFPAGVGAPRT